MIARPEGSATRSAAGAADLADLAASQLDAHVREVTGGELAVEDLRQVRLREAVLANQVDEGLALSIGRSQQAVDATDLVQDLTGDLGVGDVTQGAERLRDDTGLRLDHGARLSCGGQGDLRSLRHRSGHVHTRGRDLGSRRSSLVRSGGSDLDGSRLRRTDHDGVTTALDRRDGRAQSTPEGGAVERVAADIQTSQQAWQVAQRAGQQVAPLGRGATHVDELGVATHLGHDLCGLGRDGDARLAVDLGERDAQVGTVVGGEGVGHEALSLGLGLTTSEGCGRVGLTLRLRHLGSGQTQFTGLTSLGVGGAADGVSLTLGTDARGVGLTLRGALGDLGGSLGIDLGLLGLSRSVDLHRLRSRLGLRHVHLTAGDSSSLTLTLLDDRGLTTARLELLVAELLLELSRDLGIRLSHVGLRLDGGTAQVQLALLLGDRHVALLLGRLGSAVRLSVADGDGLVGVGLEVGRLAALLLTVPGRQVVVVPIGVGDLADVERGELEAQLAHRVADVGVHHLGEVRLVADEVLGCHRGDDGANLTLQGLLERVRDVTVVAGKAEDRVLQRLVVVAVLVLRGVDSQLRRPFHDHGNHGVGVRGLVGRRDGHETEVEELALAERRHERATAHTDLRLRLATGDDQGLVGTGDLVASTDEDEHHEGDNDHGHHDGEEPREVTQGTEEVSHGFLPFCRLSQLRAQLTTWLHCEVRCTPPAGEVYYRPFSKISQYHYARFNRGNILHF